MTYDLLIEDVVNASTHFLQPQPAIPQSARPDGPFPPVLRRFIKKVRQKLFKYIAGKGENEQCVARRPVVWRRLHAVDATRLYQTRSWVVSFLISSEFGRDSGQSLDAVRTASKSQQRPPTTS